VAALDAPYSGLQAVTTKSGDINFLVNCLAWANGTAYNENTAAALPSTARVYTDIFVRHWNVWITPQRYAVFSGVLKKKGSSYALSGGLKNLLNGIPASVTRAETPVQPDGDPGDYAISPDGGTVAFRSKAPDVPKANQTTSYIFIVPFDGSSVAAPINSPKSPAYLKGVDGASSAPRFSPDGKSLAFLQMNNSIYESDKNRLYVASLSQKGASKIKVYARDWDSTPDNIRWTPDGKSVYVSAPDLGNEKLFAIPLAAGSSASYKPKNITAGGKTGSVSSFYILPDSRALITASSIYSNRDFYTVTQDGKTTKWLLQANKIDPELKGLGPEDMDQFYYQGNATQVQAFVIYPEGFSKSKKYPLAFWPHGGPQGGWYNSWSTRWNYKTWADQGYVVIAPNPTGSTGWGMEFQDRIQNNWGSYPYDDLVRCWDHLKNSGDFDFIDLDHGVAAGASYGGFFVNWMQGHEFGQRFKALVTHDGTTSTLNQYASEELWFMQHDFNGTIWDNRENYAKWDPLTYSNHWSIPHYVIHSDLDFRLPQSEGIMLYNVLQERGVPSKFLAFPDEFHWVLDRENSLVWHAEVLGWVNHYSGVQAAPITDTTPYTSGQ
jgi:dipeptidyl aminopeptidase/acylaminoacyl peptidase